jgi:F-type H+-transporting ATPase subunit b
MRFDSSSQAAPARPTGRTAWRCPALVLAILVVAGLSGTVRSATSSPFAGASGARLGIAVVLDAAPVVAPAQEHAQPHGEGEQAEHSEGILPIVARIFNFVILAGALYYFLKSPIVSYLVSRDAQIRQDLVTARETRAAATTEMERIAAKLKALPAELEALRKQGEEDVAAERVRIARAATEERERLLEHTRREIQMQLRIARRELVEHAAQLAVDVARTRIVGTITQDDQLRLVDRYASQLSEAR